MEGDLNSLIQQLAQEAVEQQRATRVTPDMLRQLGLGGQPTPEVPLRGQAPPAAEPTTSRRGGGNGSPAGQSDRRIILQAGEPGQQHVVLQPPVPEPEPWRWQANPEDRRGFGGFVKRVVVDQPMRGIYAVGRRLIQYRNEDYQIHDRAKEVNRRVAGLEQSAADLKMNIAEYVDNIPKTVADGLTAFKKVMELGLKYKGDLWFHHNVAPVAPDATVREQIQRTVDAGVSTLTKHGDLTGMLHQAESGAAGDKLSTEMAIAAVTAAGKKRLEEVFTEKAKDFLEQPEARHKTREGGRTVYLKESWPNLNRLNAHLTDMLAGASSQPWVEDAALNFPDETREELANIARQAKKTPLQLAVKAVELVDRIRRTQANVARDLPSVTIDESAVAATSDGNETAVPVYSDPVMIAEFTNLPPDKALAVILDVSQHNPDDGQVNPVFHYFSESFVNARDQEGLNPQILQQLTTSSDGNPPVISLAQAMAEADRYYNESLRPAVQQRVDEFVRGIKGEESDPKGSRFERLHTCAQQPDTDGSLARASLTWVAEQVDIGPEITAYEKLAADAASQGEGGTMKGGPAEDLDLQVQDVVPPRSQEFIVASVDGGGVEGFLGSVADLGVTRLESPLMRTLKEIDINSFEKLVSAIEQEVVPERQVDSVVQDLITKPGVEMLEVIGRKDAAATIIENLIYHVEPDYPADVQGDIGLRNRLEAYKTAALTQVERRPNEAEIFLAMAMENAIKAVPPGRWGELPNKKAQVLADTARDIALAMMGKMNLEVEAADDPQKAARQKEAAKVAMSLATSFVKNMPPPIGLKMIEAVYDGERPRFALHEGMVEMAKALSEHPDLDSYPEVKSQWHDLVRTELDKTESIIAKGIEAQIGALKGAALLELLESKMGMVPLDAFGELVMCLPKPEYSLFLEGDRIPITDMRGSWNHPGLDSHTITQRSPVPLQKSVERLEFPGLTNSSNARDVALALWGPFYREPFLDAIQVAREAGKQAKNLGETERVRATQQQEQVLTEAARYIEDWLMALAKKTGLTVHAEHPSGDEYPHRGNVTLVVKRDTLPIHPVVAQLAVSAGLRILTSEINHSLQMGYNQLLNNVMQQGGENKVIDEETGGAVSLSEEEFQRLRQRAHDYVMEAFADELWVDQDELKQIYQQVVSGRGRSLVNDIRHALVDRRPEKDIWSVIIDEGLKEYEEQIEGYQRLFSQNAAPVSEHIVRAHERDVRARRQAIGLE